MLRLMFPAPCQLCGSQVREITALPTMPLVVEIENLVLAAVGARAKRAGQGKQNPPPCMCPAGCEIAIILAKHDGRPIGDGGANGIIGKAVRHPLAVSCRALPPLGRPVQTLKDSGADRLGHNRQGPYGALDVKPKAVLLCQRLRLKRLEQAQRFDGNPVVLLGRRRIDTLGRLAPDSRHDDRK